MLRIIAIQTLLFLAPFIVTAVYLYFTGQGFNRPETWRPKVAWLVGAGFVCMLAGFLVLAVFGGSSPQGTYKPAEFRDGVLVPGTIE